MRVNETLRDFPGGHQAIGSHASRRRRLDRLIFVVFGHGGAADLGPHLWEGFNLWFGGFVLRF
jgi:hypothetical protein